MLSTYCLEAIAIDKDNWSDSNGNLCQSHTCPEKSLQIEQFLLFVNGQSKRSEHSLF